MRLRRQRRAGGPVLGTLVMTEYQVDQMLHAFWFERHAAREFCFPHLLVDEACADPRVKLRLFGKPDARKYRRMGVAAAYGESVEEARKLANAAAASVTVKFDD